MSDGDPAIKLLPPGCFKIGALKPSSDKVASLLIGDHFARNSHVATAGTLEKVDGKFPSLGWFFRKTFEQNRRRVGIVFEGRLSDPTCGKLGQRLFQKVRSATLHARFFALRRGRTLRGAAKRSVSIESKGVGLLCCRSWSLLKVLNDSYNNAAASWAP